MSDIKYIYFKNDVYNDKIDKNNDSKMNFIQLSKIGGRKKKNIVSYRESQKDDDDASGASQRDDDDDDASGASQMDDDDDDDASGASQRDDNDDDDASGASQRDDNDDDDASGASQRDDDDDDASGASQRDDNDDDDASGASQRDDDDDDDYDNDLSDASQRDDYNNNNNENIGESNIKIIKLNSNNENNNDDDNTSKRDDTSGASQRDGNIGNSNIKIIKLDDYDINDKSNVNRDEPDTNSSIPIKHVNSSNSSFQEKNLLSKNNTENINNIIFNTNDNDSKNGENLINFLGKRNVIIEEEIAVSNKERIYKDDLVYMRELESQLLSEYSIIKQSDLMVQKKVEKEVKHIIHLKNDGNEIFSMNEKGIEYPALKNILNYPKLIQPVILDTHKIYIKLKDSENTESEVEENTKTNVYFSESLEDKRGVIEDNQKNQFYHLKTLYHEKAIDKISFKDFVQYENDTVAPYGPALTNVGYTTKINDSIPLLRYHNISTQFWNTRQNITDVLLQKDIYDEKGKIQGVEEEILIHENDATIVGFIYPPVHGETNHFEKATEIKKIENVGDGIVIECGDFELRERDMIYIGDTNCYPTIDRILYTNDIVLMDKNKLKIRTSLKLLKDGTYGTISVLSRLSYQKYKWDASKGDFQGDGRESGPNKNLYLFDSSPLRESEFQSIVQKILPTRKKIMEECAPLLEKAYSFEQIQSIFRPYGITFNQFHISEIIALKEILEKNVKSLKIEDIRANKKEKGIKTKKIDGIYSDVFILDKNVERVYGKYPHYQSPQDNIFLRFNWVESHTDKGQFYYANYLNTIYKKKNTGAIDKRMGELKKIYNGLEKELSIPRKGKELEKGGYRFDAVTISSNEDAKSLPEGSVVFYDNTLFWWKNKRIPFKEGDIEDNTMALVNKREIWYWKKDTWFKSDAVPKYEKVRFLCELKNIELSKITLDSLDSIYSKDIGCTTKITRRYRENMEKSKSELDSLAKLKDYIETDAEKKALLKKLAKAGKAIELPIPRKEWVANEGIDNKKDTDALSNLIHLIRRMEDENVRHSLLYALLEKDGLVIDKRIYSKKFGRPMGICSHYLYFKKIDYSADANERKDNIRSMISEYGDIENVDEKNVHICKVCGEPLALGDFDETEGFGSNGAIKKYRVSGELFEVDETHIDFEDGVDEKAVLLNLGLHIEDIDEAIEIKTFITQNLFPKAGTRVKNMDVLHIVIDAIQKIKKIVPYSIYRAKEIRKLKEKGFSEEYIKKLEENGAMKEGHERYFKIKRSAILAARYLISIQTALPPPMRETGGGGVCTFSSWEGEDGFDYMACIIENLNIVLIKNKTKLFDIMKESIKEVYREFTALPYIREFYEKKKEYEEIVQRKKSKLIYANKTSDSVSDPEYEKATFKEWNTLPLNGKTKGIAGNRLTFLAKSLKYQIRKVIAKSQSTDPFIQGGEGSCCSENADTYLHYYYYIQTESDYPILKNMEEANRLYHLWKNSFIETGSIHKLVIFNKDKFNGIDNVFITNDEENTSPSIIQNLFETYAETGELREYSGPTQIDSKTGQTRADILAKSRTHADVQALLRNIEKRTIRIFKEKVPFTLPESTLQTIKEDSHVQLNKQISTLVNNIQIILGKEKNFADTMSSRLRTFGFFDDPPSPNPRQNELQNELQNNQLKIKILAENKKNRERLIYLKRFFQKMRKYISIIQHKKNEDNGTPQGNENKNDKLNFVEIDEIKLELQQSIYKEKQKLLAFLNDDVRAYFKNIVINYTAEEINSIHGIDSIYNSKYDKIKKYSDFNFNEACNVMLYILVEQLNDFLLFKKSGDSSTDKLSAKNMQLLNNKTAKYKYIAQFITLLFDEMEEEYEFHSICETETIKNNIIYDRITANFKMYAKADDYMTTFIERLFGGPVKGGVNDYDNALEEMAEDDMQERTETEKMDLLMERGKEMLTKKHGTEPTEEEIKKYVDTYLADSEGRQAEMEVYDALLDERENPDAIDKGAGYGELNPYDFDDADGFNYDADV